MSLSLLSMTLPAFSPVQVTDLRGQPARLYGSSTGNLLSDVGQTTLGSTGLLSVYVDDSTSYQVKLFDRYTGQLLRTVQGVDPVASDESADSNDAVYTGLFVGAPSPVGKQDSLIILTDPCFTSRVRMRSDNTKWRPESVQAVHVNFAAGLGIGSATEQYLKSITGIPAGFLTSVRGFNIKALFAKSTTGETATLRIYLGPAGTIADTSLTALATFASGTLAVPIEAEYYALSPTSVIPVGTPVQNVALWNGAGIASAPIATTVANMDTNIMNLGFGITPNGATNVPSVPRLILTVY